MVGWETWTGGTIEDKILIWAFMDGVFLLLVLMDGTLRMIWDRSLWFTKAKVICAAAYHAHEEVVGGALANDEGW